METQTKSKYFLFFRRAGWVFATIAVLYGMVYIDVVLRARSAYLEGEKYWAWSKNPQLKAAALQSELDAKEAVLNKKLKKKKIDQSEYDRQLEIARFDHDRQLEESSLKYSYVWYKTAYELFSPPESKWVKLSRQKAPLAQERWKQELRSKNIPFQDYMVQ